MSSRALSFGNVAERYERGRPPYAEAALDWAFAQLTFRDVVDLGAGTGKLARQLAARGANVVAVEPDEAMRKVLAREVSGVEIRAGTAESIPADAASADVVTAGESFHWFDTLAAEREMHRVLRAGGGVALFWKPWEGDPLLEAVQDAIGRTGMSSPWRDEHDASLFGAVDERTFREDRTMTIDGLVDWVQSASRVSTSTAEEQERIVRDVRALVPAGDVTISVQTDVAVFHRV